MAIYSCKTNGKISQFVCLFVCSRYCFTHLDYNDINEWSNTCDLIGFVNNNCIVWLDRIIEIIQPNFNHDIAIPINQIWIGMQWAHSSSFIHQFVSILRTLIDGPMEVSNIWMANNGSSQSIINGEMVMVVVDIIFFNQLEFVCYFTFNYVCICRLSSSTKSIGIMME